VTLDGTDVKLFANVELPIQLDTADRAGAEGIGLLRTEFMFMNRDDIPSEEEQYRELKGIVGKMRGRPVTVRTLDVGGEKTAAALMGDHAESACSALGLRGIRLSLMEPELLETQLRAILRAGSHGPVRILLPMVTTVSEVRQVREALKTAARKLKRRRVAIADPLPPVGVMIEIPGAALAADSLARAADFFALGSNDLTMYTLAIDRGDEQVAHLYDPLHPAVLKAHPVHGGSRLEGPHSRFHLRRNGGRPPVHGPFDGARLPRAFDDRGQYPPGQTTDQGNGPCRRHPEIPDNHEPGRSGTHRHAGG